MINKSSSQPLVSIIVPVFNGELYLRESLDSIIAQTYPRTEVLAMDDASTDGTPEIIASYGDKVIFYRQPKNRGIYGNMNDGIEMAKGDYIAFYHADDIYHQNIVGLEVEFLQRYPEAGAVFCQAIFINSQGREFGRLEIPSEVRGGRPLSYPVVFNALLKHKNHMFWCPSCMVRASVYRDVGTYRDKEFQNTSDLEMWLRIEQKYPIGILEDYLLSYRYGHGSSSQRYHSLRTDEERYFQIMDIYLENGGKDIATPEAMAAYEAHRAEDRLMCVISHYIMGHLRESRAILRKVQASQILGSSGIQRSRLFVLFLLLQGIVRMKRISLVAKLFYRRWGIKRYRLKKSFL